MKSDSRNTRFTQNRYDAASAIYNLMEWPVEWLWYKKWRRRLWEKVEGPKVLEIGVGTGKNIPYYPKSVQVTGIDLSPGMLKRARNLRADRYGAYRILLREMDAQDLKFGDDTFDEVVATFVFCSVPDPVLGFEEALRVTKPGGRIHLLEHMLSRRSVLSSVMSKLDSPIHFITGVHIARETIRNVREAGWEMERVDDLALGGIYRMIRARNPSGV